ncbi:fluoride efflux transporter CrcB [Pseudaminobacter sp. 19-2017]|uniref:Fluoride-specific ion channel FluC n=1 Tax=Pseudaminobacter soli (ex Zhang et al. 2022) TaxID=2831468 RepID=A0A942EAF2_9HYPH|nr:fluoride efflux transporter CrcB [Pseudaminobacter soli]MBS3651432.1 fluoride efflux transporter CrcB [Pseudaminobacter soli]
MYHLLLVCLGGLLGGVARFLVSGLVARTVGETFPWGTMVVNISGSFVIGILAAVVQAHDLPALWAFAGTGFLGCYTTVSSFSLQTLALAREGEWVRAGGNVLLSVAVCLGAVALGLAASSAFAGGAG